MGDRAHIEVKSSWGPSVYLYTHWGGYKIKDDLSRGLARGCDRWDDPDYLARILFDAMKGDDVTGTTGYGISANIPDGVHWEVDTANRLVTSPEKTVYTFSEMSEQ